MVYVPAQFKVEQIEGKPPDTQSHIKRRITVHSLNTREVGQHRRIGSRESIIAKPQKTTREGKGSCHRKIRRGALSQCPTRSDERDGESWGEACLSNSRALAMSVDV